MNRTRNWGRVTAQPHEHLVVMRGGKVIKSGQGLSAFQWPWESASIFSTSVTKLSFRADQVTLEKTGVEVSGLAVYRIVEPLLAFRMLDGGTASFTDILRDMFIGATRRIVANLTLEECLTHRKEKVAEALLQEIRPVLAGVGGAGDSTSQGWGVVLDTIEIQDVKILSEEVFARLQAPFREALALRALQEKDKVERERARLDGERKNAEEQAKRALMEAEESRVLRERERAVEEHAHRELIAKKAQEGELARQREKAAAERERTEQALAIKRLTDEQGLATKRAADELALLLRRREAELEVEMIERKRKAFIDLSETRLEEILITETMPQMAEAFRGSFDKITVSMGERANAMSVLTSGIEEVMRVARSGKK